MELKTVAGEENPAGLLTKHMAAELTPRHVSTLNMNWRKGRAESAPTLDAIDEEVESMVMSWYEVESEEEYIDNVEKRELKSGLRKYKKKRRRFLKGVVRRAGHDEGHPCDRKVPPNADPRFGNRDKNKTFEFDTGRECAGND